MRPLEELVRPNIRALKPYSTARDEFSGGEITTWLDANENPYDNGVNRYPDPRQKALKARALCRRKTCGAAADNHYVITAHISFPPWHCPWCFRKR